MRIQEDYVLEVMADHNHTFLTNFLWLLIVNQLLYLFTNYKALCDNSRLYHSCWKLEVMADNGKEEELPAIKAKIPASIICFDLSCAS
jgi:hypothetical protein